MARSALSAHFREGLHLNFEAFKIKDLTPSGRSRSTRPTGTRRWLPQARTARWRDRGILSRQPANRRHHGRRCRFGGVSAGGSLSVSAITAFALSLPATASPCRWAAIASILPSSFRRPSMTPVRVQPPVGACISSVREAKLSIFTPCLKPLWVACSLTRRTRGKDLQLAPGLRLGSTRARRWP